MSSRVQLFRAWPTELLYSVLARFKELFYRPAKRFFFILTLRIYFDIYGSTQTTSFLRFLC